MAKTLIFQTPTEFDMRALEITGMSAKPNTSNPIGRFGSGLKYAIAILLRENANITLYCNGNTYTFYTKKTEFRGSTFDIVCYKKANAFLGLFSEHELPYTTEQGADWKLWQAFRELYANTLDENGQCWVPDDSDNEYNGREYLIENLNHRNNTLIVVEHFEFAQLYETRNDIFLDKHRDLVVDLNIGNVTSKQTSHIYFRNMRAFDLPEDKRAIFTYNILAEQELTEDRTLKNMYSATRVIQNMVITSDNESFIKTVLNAGKGTFEADLDFEYSWGASDAFRKVVTEQRDSPNMNRSAVQYYRSSISPPRTDKCSDSIWNEIVNALDNARDNLYAKADDIGRPYNTVDDADEIHAEYLESLRTVMNR